MAGSAAHRLLIVDDEKGISETLLKIFENAGYDSRAVHSAEEAIRVVSSTHWVPHFTLIDVNLPGMNGLDLAIVLKTKCPDCKVSLFSGQGSTSDLLEEAAKSGYVFDVVPKPIHPSELLRWIARRLSGEQSAPDDLKLTA